jgi:hypothetical protein
MREFMEILTELNWYDKSPIIPVLKKYPGKFIHFSHIPKLGINPKKHHNDPHGIYFYPTNWLLHNDSDRVKSGNQFGVKFPYYFIVSIDFSSPGIVLSSFNWDDFNRVSKMNGWADIWAQVDRYDNGELFLPTENLKGNHYKAELTFPAHFKPDSPASALWTFCYLMQKNKIMSWAQSLKNIAYIYDDNNSVIYNYEPHQILVLNTKIIKIVDSNVHTKRKEVSSFADQSNWEEWKVAVLNIMKLLAEQYKGYIKWDKKRPILLFEIDDKKFRMEYNDKWDSGLHVDFIYGRSTDSFGIPSKMMREMSIEHLIEYIENRIENVVALKSDLLFEPIISQDQAIKLGEDRFFEPNATVKWNTDVSNELYRDDKKYASMRIRGLYEKNVDGIKVTSIVYYNIYKTYFNVSVRLEINDQVISYGNNNEVYDFYNRGCSRDTLTYFLESLSNAEQLWVRQDGSETWYRPKFYGDDVWKRFVGWLAVNSGLSFNGYLDYKLEDELNIYEKLSTRDKEYLVADIKHVIRKSYENY